MPYNILAFIKASIDLNTIKIESDGRVNLDESPLMISEYDKNALEEALRIKEKYGGKVVAISILTWGPLAKRASEMEKIAREILARGADECHIVLDENLMNTTTLESSIVAASLAKKLGNFDLYITGEYSQDTTSAQFAARLGVLLNTPVVTFVNKLSIEDKELIVERTTENEIQSIKVNMPCVISVTGEINQARIPTLRQIIQAKNKPLFKYDLKQLGVTIDKREIEQEISALRVKRANIFIEGKSMEELADKMLDKLIEEGILKI